MEVNTSSPRHNPYLKRNELMVKDDVLVSSRARCDTVCTVPLASEYSGKMETSERAFKKRKTMKC